MSKEMIVSVNGREKKIAILDNGRVVEFYIERGEEDSGVVGNVYKGKVMRVLPGMQSAFVDIGLERDAFLYVSDFFDEEEEIEKLVIEKSKKGGKEAKKEANEQIDRSRIEREKQMDSAQELAEPIAESGATVEADSSVAPVQEDKKRGRNRRGRGGRGDEQAKQAEPSSAVAEPIEIVFEDDGMERIGDDEDGPGEMLKDARIQEAIVDRVRAAEFNDSDAGEATVGSLLAEVNVAGDGFERIGDDDDAADEKPKKRSSGAKKAKDEPKAEAETAEAKPKKEKAPAKKKEKAPAKPKTTRSKKAKAEDAGDEPLADAEAKESAPSEIAEMAVRRGGRGRRRGKPRTRIVTDDENGEDIDSSEAPDFDSEAPNADFDDSVAPGFEDTETPDAPEAEEAPAAEPEAEAQPAESATESSSEEAGEKPEGRSRRGRGRRGRGEREDRGEKQDREENGEQKDKPGRQEKNEKEDKNERNEKNDRKDRNDRGRNDRGRGRDRDRAPVPAISDLLREGQEILVQIAKEPIAKKGARITSHIALPGRYLVYMPTIEHLGVSRKIESSSERNRLRTLIQKIRQDPEIPQGGYIVRTAGIGVPEEDLRNDAVYLARSWQDSKKSAEKKRSPAVVHRDLDLVQRILRDQLADDFAAIRVDSEEEYQRTVEFMHRMAPKMVNRVKLYTREEPILEAYGVQEEIDKALRPRVWLRSGGYLVINQTEALVAIDVNTGKFVGKGNARLEDTITRTNMEAVDEIARQIRLRDLGGIIVLDLIDMEDRKNRYKVSQALQEALAKDKSPTKVLSFNDFGLIIMTRKRVKQSLERTMCAPCQNCEGAGWVKSPTTVCYEILAEARRVAKQIDDLRHTTLRVHPDVAKALRSSERDVLEEIESHLGVIDVTPDKSIHQGQFDFAFV